MSHDLAPGPSGKMSSNKPVFPGYRLLEKINEENSSYVLYRSVRETDHHATLILSPASDSFPEELNRQLGADYQLAKNLELDRMVRPLGIERIGKRSVLIYDDFGGVPLKRLIRTPVDIKWFLRTAIQIAFALEEIHSRGLVHQDISPSSIFVNSDTGVVKIGSFHAVIQLNSAFRERTVPLLSEETLAYMSPERTGRMNRPVDFRSDLYSAGVVFYEMLTGRLPFQSTSALDWVHFHIARTTTPPSELAPRVPRQLSDIVLKLMSKMAEDRYQSAQGLRADLEESLRLWETHGTISAFPLGTKDRSDRFQIPPRLYGREKESNYLLKTLDRVANRGTPELILISGSPGTGKSSLIHELHQPILSRWGLFTSGKFSPQNREIPYSTLTQAFRTLVQQILMERDENVRVWRKELLEALGPNAQLITALIPELELVIGPQPEFERLPITTEQHRFKLAFTRFIQVFAKKEHPLIFFLDDLQWADATSLDLIRHILSQPDLRYLLMIGAYRDTEVSPDHPLLRTFEEIEGAGTITSRITLGSLSLSNLNQLIADMLQSTTEQTDALSRMVFRKTRGNPFFVIQFMSALHREGLIKFDRNESAWKWDLQQIENKRYTDNVVDFIITRITTLNQSEQRILQVCACLGDVVPLRTLAWAMETSDEQLLLDLARPIEQGLVARIDNKLGFLHDRVRQAAYSLIPKDQLSLTHLSIGRSLLKHTPESEHQESLFDIVSQLNAAPPEMVRPEERRTFASLNLAAGIKAKTAGGYRSSVNILRRGIALLSQSSWESDHELAYNLHFELALTEFLNGETADAERISETLLSHAKTELAKARIHQLGIELFLAKGQLNDSIESGLKGLRLLGIEISKNITWGQARTECDRVLQSFQVRTFEDLNRNPSKLSPLTNPKMKAALEIFAAIIPSALNLNDNLVLFCAAQMVNISMRDGLSSPSVFGFVVFGICLDAMFERYEEGYRFGKLAYDLMSTLKTVAYEPQVNFYFGTGILFKHQHFRKCLPLAHEGVRSALENGNLNYSLFSRDFVVLFPFFMGDPLADVGEEAKKALVLSQKVKSEPEINIFTGIHQLIRCLRGQTHDLSTFTDSEFDQKKYDELMERNPFASVGCWYNIWKLHALYLAGDYEKAITIAQKGSCLDFFSTFAPGFEYNYYLALALASQCENPSQDEESKEEKKALLASISTHRSRLRKVAETCPENFLHKYLLVSAEIARIENNDLEAIKLYEDAITAARRNGFVQNEAIALETASRFYRRRGQELAANAYLKEAYLSYAAWGAEGKLKQLDRIYPGILNRSLLPASGGPETLAKQVDVMTVVKASQAISSEIELTDLIKKLMHILVENAGAQRGYLILSHDNTMWVEAEAETGREAARISPATPVQSSHAIPQSIVHYVMRTRQKVVLKDATNPNIFSVDSYISARKPRSVLCLPIIRQNDLLGLLYLENNLVAGTFVPERLAQLELLASQAAISLHNALLYSNLTETERALRESEEKLRAIVDNATSLIYLKDKSSHYRLVNRRFLELFHLTPEQIIGKSAHELWPKEIADPLWSNDQRATSARSPIECEEHIPQDDGLHTYISIKVPLFDPKGYLYGLCGISTDITERKRTEVERSKMISQLQELLKARDEFLSVASHELRTPLTPLRLHLQMVRKILEDPALAHLPQAKTFQKMLKTADREMTRLTELVQDLLDVSRIRSDEIALSRETVDLSSLVREAVARFEPQLHSARNAIELCIEPGIKGYLDRSRITQVVSSLMNNAIKFGEKQPIEIELSSDRGRAKLLVRDHGIGIARDDQARIFNRFERAVSITSFGGLGLGLFVVRQIVLAHGGTIHVESEPGKGATFMIELPLGSSPV